MKNTRKNKGLVTTALLLAAGTGSRLYPLTKNAPKCLTRVNGMSILERLVVCLNKKGFKRLVVVTGYLDYCIREYLGSRFGGMEIDYIFSPFYETTNNIYSLWMAREIINEPFLLVESDLVFDASLLDEMLYPDRIAVASMQLWMNGSTVTIDDYQQVKGFQTGIAGPFDESRYKTVNIYSFSLSSWHGISERLDQHISAGKTNNYYETVFAEMLDEGNLSLKTVSFDSMPWYEIDTLADLAEAEELLSADKYETMNSYNITPEPSGIPMQYFQQLKHKKTKTITRLLSGLGSIPQPNSLKI